LLSYGLRRIRELLHPGAPCDATSFGARSSPVHTHRRSRRGRTRIMADEDVPQYERLVVVDGHVVAPLRCGPGPHRLDVPARYSLTAFFATPVASVGERPCNGTQSATQSYLIGSLTGDVQLPRQPGLLLDWPAEIKV